MQDQIENVLAVLQRPLRGRRIRRGTLNAEVRGTMQRHHDAAKEGIELVSDRDALDR